MQRSWANAQAANEEKRKAAIVKRRQGPYVYTGSGPVRSIISDLQNTVDGIGATLTEETHTGKAFGWGDRWVGGTVG